MKYLIAGLGNIGSEYSDTRHNIGFMILDAWAKASNFVFSSGRYAQVAETKLRNRPVVLCKPNTYMNLSGKAIRFWMEKENIPLQNLLVILDDISLDPGTVRMRPSGSDGGHNGLKSIDELLGTQQYARMRIGIGSDFSKGRQSDYVLSPFTDEEKKLINPVIEKSIEAVSAFILQGIQPAMNKYNTKPGKDKENNQENSPNS